MKSIILGFILYRLFVFVKERRIDLKFKKERKELGNIYRSHNNVVMLKRQYVTLAKCYYENEETIRETVYYFDKKHNTCSVIEDYQNLAKEIEDKIALVKANASINKMRFELNEKVLLSDAFTSLGLTYTEDKEKIEYAYNYHIDKIFKLYRLAQDSYEESKEKILNINKAYKRIKVALQIQ